MLVQILEFELRKCPSLRRLTAIVIPFNAISR